MISYAFSLFLGKTTAFSLRTSYDALHRFSRRYRFLYLRNVSHARQPSLAMHHRLPPTHPLRYRLLPSHPSFVQVSRTGRTTSAPSEILDELVKRRARTGVGVGRTQQHALSGALDALLLARCDVLVGKFSSGLFRAAYALASARRGGALPPFISLDAPWCADYGVPAGYNDNFPLRYDENAGAPRMVEQINPDDVGAATGVVRLSTANEFLC